MLSIYFLLKNNMVEVFFVYGLVFFVMGLAIALQYRARSAFALATGLRHLAAFGILHGLGEWGSVFIPLHSSRVPPLVLTLLQGSQRVLWALSFTSLVAFGLELTVAGPNRRRWVVGLPAVMFLIWFAGLVLHRVIIPAPTSVWLDRGETWGRYLLGVPGLALTTYALVDQYRVLRPFNPPHLTVNLVYLALLYASYTLFGGLVVPYAPFVPASWLNTVVFLETTYLPVQVFRTLLGLAMAYFTIRLLKIFNLETDRFLEEAARQRSIIRERERISRDLHDGVMQRIYGAGLSLEGALASGEPGQPRQPPVDSCPAEPVREAIDQLNQAMDDLRRYVMGLKPVEFLEPDLHKGLEGIVAAFRAHSALPVFLAVGETPCRLPPEEAENLYLMVSEALQNARRHAMATAVQIKLHVRPAEVQVCISDNGVGFDPQDRAEEGGGGQGLQNMQQRARSLGGAVSVESRPGSGTTVRLNVPMRGWSGDQDQRSRSG